MKVKINHINSTILFNVIVVRINNIKHEILNIPNNCLFLLI